MPWSSLLGSIREYAIFTLDDTGVVDSWNLGVRELLGYQEQEFIGQRGDLIFTEEDRSLGAFQAELATARATGEAMDDRWHQRKDGSRFWANGIMHAVRDESGKLIGYLKLMRDQTEKRTSDARQERQRRLITAILDSLPGVFYVSDGRRLVRWNEEFERVTGLSTEELAAAAPEDLLVEVERAREHVEDVLSGGRRSFEGHLKTKRGLKVPFLFTSHRVVLDEAPLILGVGIEASRQIRSRELLERRAQEQTTFAELAAFTLAADDMTQVLDLAVHRVKETLGVEDVTFTEVAPAATESAGTTASRSGPSAGPVVPNEAPGALRAPIQRRGRTFGYLEVRSAKEPFSEDDASFLAAVADLLAGAVEQHRLVAELEHRAETDDLTGLLKRVAFEHRLSAALGRAERQGTKVAVMFIDLDRFKQVNDSFGHQAGDEILKEVARRILDSVRSWDAVARHGGDEFVLFLPDIKADDEVANVAERLLEAMTAPFTLAGQELTVGATMGIALYPDDGEDAGSLLRAADSALYKGKAAGRHQYHYFQRG